jgi:hypothetical protein
MTPTNVFLYLAFLASLGANIALFRRYRHHFDRDVRQTQLVNALNRTRMADHDRLDAYRARFDIQARQISNLTQENDILRADVAAISQIQTLTVAYVPPASSVLDLSPEDIQNITRTELNFRLHQWLDHQIEDHASYSSHPSPALDGPIRYELSIPLTTLPPSPDRTIRISTTPPDLFPDAPIKGRLDRIPPTPTPPPTEPTT